MKSKGVHVRLSPELWKRAKDAIKGPDPRIPGSLSQLMAAALREKLERARERAATSPEAT